MKKRYSLKLIIMLLIFSSCTARETEIMNSDSIKLKISNKEIKLRKDSLTITLHARLENNFGKAVLMYGFGIAQEAKRLAVSYENDNGSAGAILVVLDKSYRQIIPTVLVDIHDDLDNKPVTQKVLQQSLLEAQNQFLSKKVVLNSYSELETTLFIKLEYHNLEAGEYNIYLIYHSGKDISKVVQESLIKEDLKEYRAELFQGWIKSDTVKLVVE